MKCKVCGKRFKLQADKRYDVLKQPDGFAGVLSGEGKVCYECFDCPRCGCQNIVNIREGVIFKDIKTVTNAEEAKEYQISEDISKGFEEFNKIIFGQEQVESEEV